MEYSSINVFPRYGFNHLFIISSHHSHVSVLISVGNSSDRLPVKQNKKADENIGSKSVLGRHVHRVSERRLVSSSHPGIGTDMLSIPCHDVKSFSSNGQERKDLLIG